MLHERIAYMKDHNPYIKLVWLYWRSVINKLASKQSDIKNINKLYKKYSGHYPNLEAPESFSEKMQWLKLYYRNPQMVIAADKYSVREFVAQKGLNHILNNIYGVFDFVEQIDIEKLPEKFVLKATHSTGWNLIVKDKSKLNWGIWKHIVGFWLNHNISANGREWHYAEMTPHVICEKYLEDASGNLMDYKFFCFNGIPHFLQVNLGRGNLDTVQNFYDLDWHLLPFGKSKLPNKNAKISKPLNFELMIKYAKVLSEGFPFVRVDFYEAEGHVYFWRINFFSCLWNA